MLSGMEEGDRHQTFTESYFCDIDLLIRPIRSESDCELAVSDTVIANIIENIRFICNDTILQKSAEKIKRERCMSTKFQQWAFHYFGVEVFQKICYVIGKKILPLKFD